MTAVWFLVRSLAHRRWPARLRLGVFAVIQATLVVAWLVAGIPGRVAADVRPAVALRAE
jgi:hypothetical protein